MDDELIQFYFNSKINSRKHLYLYLYVKLIPVLNIVFFNAFVGKILQRVGGG